MVYYQPQEQIIVPVRSRVRMNSGTASYARRPRRTSSAGRQHITPGFLRGEARTAMTTQKTLASDEILRRYFDEARICRVATTGPDGPHVAPFCPVLDGHSTLYIEAKSTKRTIRNIMHDPHVVILVDDYIEDWRGLKMVSVTGTGRALTPDSGREFQKASRLLRAKFPQFRWLKVDVAFVLAVDLIGVRRAEGLG